VVGGRASRGHVLALLALLAGAGGRPLTRDKLIGLLWPERDDERARHLLSQSLYVLRGAAGGRGGVDGGQPAPDPGPGTDFGELMISAARTLEA
jgi:DNA-binding SARP family transcriptional activator